MILLIDNYDSFSYNLVQMIGAMNPDIRMIRNDEMTPDEIEALQAERIIISPGPGKPSEAGYCIDTIRRFAGKVPILGVCLGHQAIYEAFGGTVSYAKQLMHGKQSVMTVEKENPLFAGIGKEMLVGRYHSLAALEDTRPEELEVLGRSSDGEIMAICHRSYPVYGLQFHPESILTPEGNILLKNFLTVS